MAGENAFDKKLGAETHMDKVEGLLEHLNLPPKAIDFIRNNQRLIQVGIAIIVIAVVFWSLYGSYREKIREEASSALSLALRSDQEAKPEALRAVADEYSGTSSALWAQVELAHIDMKNGMFNDASKKYQEVLSDTKAANPIYPLVIFSLAQSFEKEQRYQEAINQYELLKNIKGFELIAYKSMARIEEEQGNVEKAIAIYNNFLLQMGDDPSFLQAEEEINAKIARLKAQK
jgi:predicted negative regulator of RcsB-dependent stress response